MARAHDALAVFFFLKKKKNIVNGANAVNFFITHPPVHWNMVVPPVQILTDVSVTELDALEGNSRGIRWHLLPMKPGWNNTRRYGNVQRR